MTQRAKTSRLTKVPGNEWMPSFLRRGIGSSGLGDREGFIARGIFGNNVLMGLWGISSVEFDSLGPSFDDLVD